MSDEEIQNILMDSKNIRYGIGGSSQKIKFKNDLVFVKKIPVSNFELSYIDSMSTANIFNLPMYYHYGVGSLGFSVWRELETHLLTTKWVLNGDCMNFPVLYHWRLIPDDKPKIDFSYWKDLDDYLNYWGNNHEINNRANLLINAKHSLIIFLEFFPKNLSNAMIENKNLNEEDTLIFLETVNNDIEKTLKFLSSKSFVHFDVHFENIVTDDKNFYISDFGLALTDSFELSKVEKNFLNDHKNFDYGSYYYFFVNKILNNYITSSDWDGKVLEYNISIFKKHLPKKISAFIENYYYVACEIQKFYINIMKDKTTLYDGSMDKLL
tara:strand:- start:1705 stop:2676 length:972 start_codon:yes stop_codon:yes gene_type:complete